MIVTVDGPAGAGKSSVARKLAERLGFRFLDTGAMYRAVIFAALDRGVPLEDPQALARLAESIDIELEGDLTRVDGKDVSTEIRMDQVTRHVFHAADNLKVRQILSDRQREIAQGHDIVSEGRDQGTVVFPNAECKIFLTASAEERARRRVSDLEARGQKCDFQEVLQSQNRRDEQDYNREVGRLQKAEDAIEVSTDSMSAGEVLDTLENIVLRHRSHR